MIKQSAGQLVYRETDAGLEVVYAWAVEADPDAEAIKSNTFEMEWPPHSGKTAHFPRPTAPPGSTIEIRNPKSETPNPKSIRPAQTALHHRANDADLTLIVVEHFVFLVSLAARFGRHLGYNVTHGGSISSSPSVRNILCFRGEFGSELPTTK